MKSFKKEILFGSIVVVLVISGFLFFSDHIQSDKKNCILGITFIILLGCFIYLTILKIKDETSIKKAKLKKLKTLIGGINEIQEDSCLKDNVKEIKNNIVEIKGKIKDLQSDKSNGEDLTKAIKELSEKMSELEIILQPLSFKSDIFKAYANAIVEI